MLNAHFENGEDPHLFGNRNLFVGHNRNRFVFCARGVVRRVQGKKS